MGDRACARMVRTSSPIRSAVTAHAVQRTDGKRRERGIGKEQAADVAVIPSTAQDLLRQQSGKIPRCARDDSEEQLAHFAFRRTNGTGKPPRPIPSSSSPLLAPPPDRTSVQPGAGGEARV